MNGMIMQITYWKWHVLVIALFVNGCIVPTTPKEKHTPPATENMDDLAVIHVYRVKVFFGSGNDIDILVDGKAAGEIGNGESLPILVEPGVHTITPADWGSAAAAPVFTYKILGIPIEHDFLSGHEYYIRWKPRSLKDSKADMFQFTDEIMHRDRH